MLEDELRKIFSVLERLIGEKPNSNIMTYEASGFIRTDTTSEWKNNLSTEECSTRIIWAPTTAAEQYEDRKRRN